MNITIPNTDPIIMIDDRDADRHIAQWCYQKSSLQNPFMMFSEGTTFLAHMNSVLTHEAPMPALILVDLNMPQIDGFELLALIRQHPEFAHVPIVVLTTTDNPKDVRRSMEMGANGFQTKPFHVADYISFFNSFCA
jgi:CheY-like chemotaxis protein